MSRRGIVLFEVVVVILLLFCASLLAASATARRRELSRRAVCAANVRGIGMACKIYANDFCDWWPVAPHDKDKFTRIGAIGTHREDGDTAHADPSVGQCLYIVIRSGGATMKQFVCPGADPGDKPDQTANPMPFYDFQSGSNLSYGYQYPYGESKALPTEALDPRLAMIADKCYHYVGAGLKDGRQADFNKWTRTDWVPYNSEHHQGDGQNVLFQDGHAAFVRTPACGLERTHYPRSKAYKHNDLIYENADGVFGGLAKGWPLDRNDSVVVHGPTTRPSKPKAVPLERPTW